MTRDNQANIGGTVGFPNSGWDGQQRMANYDRLPRPFRDLLKYAFVNLNVVPGAERHHTPSGLADTIRKRQQQATLDTYGPDHPGATEANR